ncbi:MAG: hypothetical protein EXR39_08235 [Betaproteobacteria bacterium]|nr:hypothetical protein [Betaproteobacteria bacterium]
MSVLAEAFSVVVPVNVLERSYPGGLARYMLDAPNHSYCSDGVLTRVGFLARKDAEYFVAVLETAGLLSYDRGIFIDVALVDQNVGPLAPCLWLEFARERNGAPVCWHVASRRGAMQAPPDWEMAVTLVHARFIGRPFAEQMRYLRSEAQLDWYHDRSSGRVFTAPQPFPFH